MNSANSQTAANIRRYMADKARRQRNDDIVVAGAVARGVPYEEAARAVDEARGDLPLCRFGPGGDFTIDYTPDSPSPKRSGLFRRLSDWLRGLFAAKAEGRS